MVKFTKEAIELAVNKSYSISGTLRLLGVYPGGGGYRKHIKNQIIKFGIDTSHFRNTNTGISSRSRLKHDQVLVINRNNGVREDAKVLRRALIESGLEYKCVKCGNNGNWYDSIITLEVDHINSNYLDNRKENLQFLCPNCHAIKTNPKTIKIDKRKLPRKYIPKISNRKVERPSKEQLENLLLTMNRCQIARQYNVSETSIRKWIKWYSKDN